MPSRSTQLRDLTTKYPYTPFMYVEYPHKSFWSTTFGDGDTRAALGRHSAAASPPSTLFYVHMPYCHRQCYFCTCHVVITKDYADVTQYMGLLYREFDLLREIFDRHGMRPDIREIHLGGGSPTYLREREFDELVARCGTLADLARLDEFAIEIDPRRVDRDRLRYYHSKGINRISFGVQDFDLQVQKAVNRVQPAKLTERLLTPDVRDLFAHGVNFDILCGLPHQTRESFRRTLETVVRLSPDRICLNYMDYSPQFAPHQLLMPADDLPDLHAKKVLFREAIDILTAHDYVRTGYDHFAKPSDAVAAAMTAGLMSWNPLGYTPGRYQDTLATGVSGSSRIDDSYYQNSYDLSDYAAKLGRDELPVFRGHRLSPDDRLRRAVIHQLRSYFAVDRRQVSAEHGVDFDAYFPDELARLDELIFDGLVETDASSVRVTKLGREFVNLACRAFDAYAWNSPGSRTTLGEPPARAEHALRP